MSAVECCAGIIMKHKASCPITRVWWMVVLPLDGAAAVGDAAWLNCVDGH